MINRILNTPLPCTLVKTASIVDAEPAQNQITRRIFSLTNIIKFDICFTQFHSSTTELFLTNKPHPFQKKNVVETGLSDHRKLILFKILLRKAQIPKIVYYRD